MKFFRALLLLPVLCCVASSCGDDDKTEEVVAVSSLELTSQSIMEGSEVEASSVKELKLTYSKMLTLSPTADIKVNGVTVTPRISVYDIIIPLDLSSGSSYTIQIAAGSILAKLDANCMNPAFALTFTTKEAPVPQLTKTLSNVNATQSAQNVYSFLVSQYGQKTLSATMANVSWNFAEAELVYKATGKYPAIATMDYIHLFTLMSRNPYPGWKVPYDDLKEVEAWWNNNGLLAASWHWNMPNKEGGEKEPCYTCTPGDGTKNKDGNWTTTCKPSNVMKEGTWEKTIADEDLAKMAELFLALQEKGIPLIFRPLHEASGNTYSSWNLQNGKPKGNAAWFWWGCEGADVYRQLWIYLYTYFQKAGVNNLIWVWTSQNNGDTDWYPGDEYVDIIGQDIYNQQADNNASDYQRLQQTYPGKIVTLSECGNVGAISAQWQKGARWSYFMPWYQYDAVGLDSHMHADAKWWKDAMSSPYVLTREDMPSLK